MDTFHLFLDVFQHLPDHIAQWSAWMGGWIYALLFGIIFAETGLVVTPILPGDSLLFAAGVLTTVGGPLSLSTMLPLLAFAAVAGDMLNYSIGRGVGARLLRSESRLINKKYLEKAREFYQRHGGKAVILARFFPIIRTYAPFVAGLSQMPRRRYAGFSVVGGCLWTWAFLLAGHWFGDLPVVKTGFHYVILGIAFVSVLPALWQFFLSRGGGRGSEALRRG
jgi:membrane-associated protein